MRRSDLDYYPGRMNGILQDVALMTLDELRQERLLVAVKFEQWGDYYERMVGVIDAIGWMRDRDWTPFDWETAIAGGIVKRPVGSRSPQPGRPNLRLVE